MRGILEVLWVYLGLGVTAFGGPVAHLAYFRRELVVRRGWISEEGFARLVALGQFLPGPTSSQVGVLVGWQRAGVGGAVAAAVGFTLPAALLLAGAAWCWGRWDLGPGWLIGVKAMVLGVVGHALVGMAGSLCPDLRRRLLALGVLGAALAGWGLTGLAVAGVLGVWYRGGNTTTAGTGELRLPSQRLSLMCLGLAAGVLAWAWGSDGVAAICARAGGLVVGGGHVVLPLLHDPLVTGGWLDHDRMLAGYGLAQVVPGPLFAVAAWIGSCTGGVLGAVAAVLAIFAPGLLLALGSLRFYHAALDHPRAQGAVAGLGAGVVGLLAATLWDPLLTGSSWVMVLGGAAAYAGLRHGLPPWLVVLMGAGIGALTVRGA